MKPTDSQGTTQARREMIKQMVAAGAALTLAGRPAHAIFDMGLIANGRTMSGKGYGTDPDMMKTYKPGDFWPLTMTPEQRRLTSVLADLVIPADGGGPSAASLEIDAFMDEWVSAPYPNQVADRKIVLEGLSWIDAESQRRFTTSFVAASPREQTAILDDICYVAEAAPQFKDAARFFDRFRDLVATGYYTTPEGMKDIGYVGNVPSPRFEGAPTEVLKKLGLA